MSGSVSFGLGMITGQRATDDLRSFQEIYEDLITLCCEAEQMGFDTAWLSEHHFVDDGYMPSLLPVAAAISSRTSRIRVGTGILIAPLHHPLRLAEDVATVDQISAGRVVLGIGAGYREEEFAGFAVEKKGLGSSLDHTIGLLRDAWQGKPVKGSPEADAVRVFPPPCQLGGPEIWIGARTTAGLKRVGRSADGLIAARVSPAELADQVTVMSEALEMHSRDRSDITVATHCPVFVTPDSTARARFEPYLHYSEWKYWDMVSQPYGSRTSSAQPGELSDRGREQIWASAIIGPPEEVRERIRDYIAAAPGYLFHFIPRLYWPGMDRGLQSECVAAFAEGVIASREWQTQETGRE